MGILFDLLTFPVLGVPRGVQWLSTTVAQAAMQELLDEGAVRAALVELQERYDAGDLSDQDYDVEEGALIERLQVIREWREEHG